MTYQYFLTSLEVNSSKHFFNGKKMFTPYDSHRLDAEEYDYEIIIYPPSEEEYQYLEKSLDINNKGDFHGTFKYLTHVPIWIKLQKEYFKSSKKLEVELAEFINNFLTLHQYFYNDYGVPTFKLDGREILHKLGLEERWKKLKYDSLIDIDFFEHLQESIVYGEASPDLVSMLTAKKKPLEFNWTLLLEGIKAFYEANMRQALINCCTSLEVTISEPIKNWLLDLTLTKSKDPVSQLFFDISNPLKFEFYVNTINPEPFKIYEKEELKKILADLKSLNSLRNRVAHDGHKPSLNDAKTAIESTSKFLTALWVFERPSTYKQMKKS